MKNLGLTKCPYCGKGINLFRLFSLKRRGEYMCPRCRGISNVFLYSLIYVVAVLAVTVSVLIFTFDVILSNNITYMTPLKVLIPYLVFYCLSVFFVNLKKPVIRKIRKTADGRYFDEEGTEMQMKMGKLVPLNKINM